MCIASLNSRRIIGPHFKTGSYMNTLIVHPQDESTDFLKVIYQSIPNPTVVTGGISHSDLTKLIQEHSSIIMLGHGAREGLFSVGQFISNDQFIVDHRMVKLLRSKSRCIYIWCHADWFTIYYKLRGFYTGMFISQVDEAWACRIEDATPEMVEESNTEFCRIIGQVINEDAHTIYNTVKDEYSRIAKVNPVAFYNWRRLYVR